MKGGAITTSPSGAVLQNGINADLVGLNYRNLSGYSLLADRVGDAVRFVTPRPAKLKEAAADGSEVALY